MLDWCDRKKSYLFSKKETVLIVWKAIAIIPAYDNDSFGIDNDNLNYAIEPGLTDLVNNKITNLGKATAPGDAMSKSAVDSQITALAIALS